MSDNQKKRFATLFKRFFFNTASQQEKNELARLAEDVDVEELEKLLVSLWETQQESMLVLESQSADEILKKILKPKAISKIIPLRKRILTIAAAAAVLAAIFVGANYLLNLTVSTTPQAAHSLTSPEEVLPGGNRAILTLDDGLKLALDDLRKGVVATQSGVRIVNTGQGSVEYEKVDEEHVETQFNTIETPRGGQFKLVLPDGTVAYLNASSKIRFPVAFPSNERKVEVEGEVFFEVARKKDWPFVVSANSMMVEALGTSFNIMGYNDEPSIKTTLISGSVKVTANDSNVVLKPNQQSVVDKKGRMMVLEDVDVDDVIAWKNGLFVFSSLEIEEIMRQISRWYNLDVIYLGKVPDNRYTGIVSRNSSLAQVLKIMERAGIKFTVRDKEISVGF